MLWFPLTRVMWPLGVHVREVHVRRWIHIFNSGIVKRCCTRLCVGLITKVMFGYMSRTPATLLINTMTGYRFAFGGCYNLIPDSYHTSHKSACWRNCRQKYESRRASTCHMLLHTHLSHSNNICTITGEVNVMTIYSFTFVGCYKLIPDSYHISYTSAWWRKYCQKYMSHKISYILSQTIFVVLDHTHYPIRDSNVDIIWAHMLVDSCNCRTKLLNRWLIDSRLLCLQYDMSQRRRVDHKIVHIML